MGSNNHYDPIDFAAINRAALQRLPELLAEWLPGGKRKRREYVVLNPRRADGNAGSFSINLASGKWADFATKDGGTDPISLHAYLRGMSQVDAARELAQRIGMESVAEVASVAAPVSNGPAETEWKPIIPVPTDAPALTRQQIVRFRPNGYRDVDTYSYRKEDGSVFGVIVRFDGPIGLDGKQSKSFRPFTYCQGSSGKREWRCQGIPEPRPLYGLHWLPRRPDAPVLVVEGEKTTHAAHRIFTGHCAVSSLNGAHSPRKTDWSPLVGRDVRIWPDADEPGLMYAATVADLAKAAGAKSVSIVDVAGLPSGWDVADPLPNGLSNADLDRMLAEARPIGGEAQDRQDPPRDAQPKTSPSSDGPLPLFPELPPAEPYPIDALGPILAPAARAIARKIQVSPVMAAQSVLAAAAIAAQSQADVLLPFGQDRPFSLYFVTVAASGDRKSSSDNEASWPLATREKALREQYKEENKDWKINYAAWAAQKKKIEGDNKLDLQGRKERLAELGEEPPKPLAPFLTSGDLTIEGLTKGWPDFYASLGIFTAEAGQFTGGHGMSDDSRLRTAALMSEAWDGKPMKRLRALDGISILSGRRLSMHLMVQPHAAAGFLANEVLRDQGLLSRVLVSAPDSIAGTRLYKEVDPSDDRAIHAYGARILSILEAPEPLVEGTRNELDPRALPLSDDAAAAWRKFHDHIETQCGPAGSLRPIRDFAAKAAEHAARIAGVLTIVAERERAAEIGVAAMANALTLGDWYVAEALRLQAGARMDPKLLKAQALLDWMNTQTGEIQFREILRLGPNHLRTKSEAEAALKILVEHGSTIEISGRPRRFRVVTQGASQ